MKGTRETKSSRLLLLAKMILAGLLLFWLVQSGRLQLSTLASIQLSRELLALIMLMFVSMALPALRWWWLCRLQQIDVRLLRISVLTWAGYFLSLVLPGSASGDMVRSYLIVRDSPNARRSIFHGFAGSILGCLQPALLGARRIDSY